jgi:hypothetical protein
MQIYDAHVNGPTILGRNPAIHLSRYSGGNPAVSEKRHAQILCHSHSNRFSCHYTCTSGQVQIIACTADGIAKADAAVMGMPDGDNKTKAPSIRWHR